MLAPDASDFALGEIVGALRERDDEQQRHIDELVTRVTVLEQRGSKRLHALGTLARDNAAFALRAPVAGLIGALAGILIDHLHRVL